MEKKSVFGLSENLASLLCYALLFFSGIVVLVLERENKAVRFHALQSTLWFGLLAIAGFILGMVPLLGGLLSWIIGTATLVSWLLLMALAFTGKKVKVPIIGDVVEAQVNR